MRRMGIGLGVGINRSNYAQGIFSAYQSRVIADGGVTEAGACVDAVSGVLQSASLLLIPSGYKSGKAYAEIPTNGNGDLTWTRASTALRTNSSGLLESMGSGVPRLSYMYGSCPSALLEPQRTNLVLQSNTFNTTWALFGGATITSNSTTSPDGSTNATTLNSAGGSNDFLYQSFTVNNATTYTVSFFVKNVNSTQSKFYIPIAAFPEAFINWTGSTITSVTSSGTNSFTAMSNGWYRVSVTATATATGVYIFRIYSDNNNTSKSVYIYGAQLEAGAYPTTYIPTTSATATRVADSFSRSNIYTNGLISASGGTWFVELRNNIVYTRDNAVEGLFLGSDSVGTTNSFTINAVGGGGRLRINKIVSGVFSQLYLTTTDTIKIAIKWDGTTADVFVNGTKQVSGTTFTTTQLQFLAHSSTSGDVPKFIQQMALFPTPLSDTDCTTLTTL